MTPFAFHIAAGPLPFIPYGPSLTQQVPAAVEVGLWVNLLTLETGVEFQ
jgi:hypothetical protein